MKGRARAVSRAHGDARPRGGTSTSSALELVRSAVTTDNRSARRGDGGRRVTCSKRGGGEGGPRDVTRFDVERGSGVVKDFLDFATVRAVHTEGEELELTVVAYDATRKAVELLKLEAAQRRSTRTGGRRRAHSDVDVLLNGALKGELRSIYVASAESTS